MAHIFVRNAVSGVSTHLTTDEVVRDAPDPRDLTVAVDCFLVVATDALAARPGTCEGIASVKTVALIRSLFLLRYVMLLLMLLDVVVLR